MAMSSQFVLHQATLQCISNKPIEKEAITQLRIILFIFDIIKIKPFL